MNTENQQNLDTDNTAETDSAAQTEKAACTSSKIQILRENSIYLLPNSFTIAALFCAFYAITQSMHGRFESAAISVFTP